MPADVSHSGSSMRTVMRHHAPLVVVLIVVAALAIALHRNGISWGDDDTLYLRQAKGLVDGNVGQVIADNHANVDLAAKPGFSPYVYPWGWPMLLAPFVRLWGLDWARLKLLEVACLCGFLAFFHAVVRRRTTLLIALGLVAAIGSTSAYLRHTDALLSELPYMLGVAATLWWLDRCRRGHRLDEATRCELIVLGVLAMVVFSVRREGLAMVPAIAAVQLVEMRGRWRRADRRALAMPHVAFVVAGVVLQLALPSTLAPRYTGAGLGQTWKKLHGSFRIAFGDQLGFDHLAGAGLWLVVALVAIGIVMRLRHHAADDIGLVVFAVVSTAIVGMIPSTADRYLLAITPFAVYFAVQAAAVPGLRRGAGQWLAVGSLAALVVLHATKLPEPIRAAQRDNDVGVQDGPSAPYALAAFDAVRRHTHQTDIVAFFKARALTLFTDRRAVQSSDLQIVRERADFFMMRRGSSFSQPLVSDQQATAMGWTNVWSDPSWVLWRLPRLDG